MGNITISSAGFSTWFLYFQQFTRHGVDFPLALARFVRLRDVILAPSRLKTATSAFFAAESSPKTTISDPG